MQDPDSLVQIGTGVTLSQFFELIAKIPEPVLYIALTAWLLLYVIGWFGGINAHTKVALITVISSTLIAIGALPVPPGFLNSSCNISPIPLSLCFWFFRFTWRLSSEWLYRFTRPGWSRRKKFDRIKVKFYEKSASTDSLPNCSFYPFPAFCTAVCRKSNRKSYP